MTRGLAQRRAWPAPIERRRARPVAPRPREEPRAATRPGRTPAFPRPRAPGERRCSPHACPSSSLFRTPVRRIRRRVRRIGRLAPVRGRVLRSRRNLRRIGSRQVIEPCIVRRPDAAQELEQSRIIARALRALRALSRVPRIRVQACGGREHRRPEEQRRRDPFQPLAPPPGTPPVSPPEVPFGPAPESALPASACAAAHS